MPQGNSKPPFKTLAPVKLDTRRRNGTPVSEVIIKPAEKGGAVVVWDRDLYIAEAHRQLDDNSSYQSLPVPSLPHDQKTISVSVNKLSKSNKGDGRRVASLWWTVVKKEGQSP